MKDELTNWKEQRKGPRNFLVVIGVVMFAFFAMQQENNSLDGTEVSKAKVTLVNLELEMAQEKELLQSQLQEMEGKLKQANDLGETLQNETLELRVTGKNDVQRLQQQIQSLEPRQKEMDIQKETPQSAQETKEIQSRESTNEKDMNRPKETQKDAPEHIDASPIFPETFFTPHVKEVISVIENLTLHAPEPNTYNPLSVCDWGYRVVVDKPYTHPSRIECGGDRHYCGVFQKIFLNESRILPYNVSFGYKWADKMEKNDPDLGQCVGSSSPKGQFIMNNFHEARTHYNAQYEYEKFGHNPNGFRWEANALPWEERHAVPVFRGSARLKDRKIRPSLCPDTVAELGHRPKAVAFSLAHPDLLDAMVKPEKHPCEIFNHTNGMDKMFRMGKYATKDKKWYAIKEGDYYTKYQTSVVLGGIGAAFRVSIHMSAGQAVVLQDYNYEEWFVNYMTPWIHYIPLQKDLSDLEKIMRWIKENPAKVKKIAEEGKKFYWDHFSFLQNEEHWYEFMWRLSLLINEQGSEQIKHGNFWPSSKKLNVFLWNSTGSAYDLEAPIE